MISLNNKNLCENCFSEIELEPCPCCGFSGFSYHPDPMTLPIGIVLASRYKVGGVIGKGGFGITYLGYDLRLKARIAIKEYYPVGLAVRTPGNPLVSVSNPKSEAPFKEGAEKFYNEASMVAQFNGNPNIVSVYDFFYENNTVYFIMGFLQGQTLKSYINNRTISEGQAISIIQGISNALAATHGMRILHRDISPDNIMLCDDGSIKLIDFGAARQVVNNQGQALSIILKQGFAPLEQYQKKGNQGPWTDIYALGATIYSALTGEEMDDPMSRLENDSNFQSNKHGISGSLWRILKKMTMLSITDRYQSVKELQLELSGLDIYPEPLIVEDDLNSTSCRFMDSYSENPIADSNATTFLPDDAVSSNNTVAISAIDIDSSANLQADDRALYEEAKTRKKYRILRNEVRQRQQKRKLAIILSVMLFIVFCGSAGILIFSKLHKTTNTISANSISIEASETVDNQVKTNTDSLSEEDILYSQGLELMEQGKYYEAYSAFRSIGKYKESEDKSKECKTCMIDTAEIGSTIVFGTYDYDTNNEGDDPLEWIVLDKKDDSILITTSSIIDMLPFDSNTKGKYKSINYYDDDGNAYYQKPICINCDWSTSSIREWLNKDFLNHFEEYEARRIIMTELDNSYDSQIVSSNDELGLYKVVFDGSNNTVDKVFLLSMIEYSKYLKGLGIPNEYRGMRINLWCRAPRVILSESYYDNRIDPYTATTVYHVGDDAYYANPDTKMGIRPAMWITKETNNDNTGASENMSLVRDLSELSEDETLEALQGSWYSSNAIMKIEDKTYTWYSSGNTTGDYVSNIGDFSIDIKTKCLMTKDKSLFGKKWKYTPSVFTIDYKGEDLILSADGDVYTKNSNDFKGEYSK